MDRLCEACLGDTQEPRSSRQLGTSIWAETNPVREEIGRLPGLLESREGENSARQTWLLQVLQSEHTSRTLGHSLGWAAMALVGLLVAWPDCSLD